MNRSKRREKHTYTGAQLEELIEHNVNEGFQQGKAVTIGKMTEVYSVAATYAILSAGGITEETAKELVDQVLGIFKEFNTGKVDYDEAVAFVKYKGYNLQILPEELKDQVAQEQP